MRAIRVAAVALGLLAASCHPASRPARLPSSQGTTRTHTPPLVTTATSPTARVVLHGRRDLPLVALTFDSNLTVAMERELDRHQVASFDNRAVIDELDRLHVPATFFLAGLWIERYPDETRRLATDPLFELGSHSYLHRPFAAHCYGLGTPLPDNAMAADIGHSEVLLHHFSVNPTRYFRFPGGCYTPAALAAAARAGVVVVEYDLPSGDAFGRSVSAIVRTVLSGVRDGSIVVMHITGGNTAPLTAAALPAIVTHLRARGFELVRVSDLLART